MKVQAKHRIEANFLSNLEASCCARNLRQAFWDYLPVIIAHREQNNMWSLHEAISEITFLDADSRRVGEIAA